MLLHIRKITGNNTGISCCRLHCTDIYIIIDNRSHNCMTLCYIRYVTDKSAA